MRVLAQLQDEDRPATAAEQHVLSQWSSWGAVPDVFDEQKPEWDAQRAQLKTLLPEKEYTQARRTVLNAHYTNPAYVGAVWDTVRGLGFTEGNVLEPGSGSGTFIGLAPEGVNITGVELDSTTARISQYLYPDATIRSESFAETRLPAGFFDVTVGNVPFGRISLHDPIDNANGHSIHNHFILKSLRLTRPGGIVAVLTSHYTLDQKNPAARREMAAYGDLIGAVRLPTGAHRRTAGTEAVTDLLIFRRHTSTDRPDENPLWEGVSPRRVGEVTLPINNYFDAHPEHILGDVGIGHGMYGAASLTVTANLDDVPEKLRAALTGIVHSAGERGQQMTPRGTTAPAVTSVPNFDEWDGTLHALDDGSFVVTNDGARIPFAVPMSVRAELRALLKIRDAATLQLSMERAQLDDTVEILQSRAELHSLWTTYVDKYGPLNRYTETRTGRFDEDDEPVFSRRTPTALRLLRSDPFGPLVMSIEVFDDATQTAEPAAILRQRMILPRPDKQGADTPSEALQLSLNRSGAVDLIFIARALGETPEVAREQLGTLVFNDPDTGTLVPAPEYLSGNVLTKLDYARAAAATDPMYAVNVTALENVVPVPLTPQEITARVGAVWISPVTHQTFLRELLKDPNLEVSNPLPATWKVTKANRHTVRASSDWGTERRPGSVLFEQLANQSEIKVEDEYEDSDGRTRKVLNPLETAAAQEKAALLQDRFEEWVWEDPTRAASLTAEYNRRFNATVLRDYSEEGAYLTLPGMVASFTLRDHQRAAVARMLSEPAVGLFHEVGAGKTAEMVAGAMELRRLGMANKIGVVVPNHMLEQFTREWLQLYPQARILAANTETLSKDKRRLFVARAAANDWDAIVMTREAFKKLPVEPETESAYLEGEVAVLRHALTELDSDDRRTVKTVETALANLEAKQKRLLDQERDPGITFEATGIDYLIVDEFHDYKNLTTASKITDANIVGSFRATDMHMKLGYLRNTHGARVVTVATATPIANSITEAHVMQRYLRPDLLREAGVEAFDSWAATFGEKVTDVEMAPQGGGAFRLKTRFSKFVNVPEMLRMWHVFADVKTAEDLNLPVPLLRAREDGKRLPETVALTAGEHVHEYVADLGERAERIQQRQPRTIDGKDDNMLWVSSDGRKAAVDYRLIDPHVNLDAEPIPLRDVAANIARIYELNKNNQYLDARTGEDSPTRGALQIVFCDLGTPSDRWNAYDELKRTLIENGVPAEGIRFVHEAKNDSEKARLFESARQGGVAVLIGSTMKMGVGTNVQARAVALHDVDCPWRPADIAQRHGRIIRQGNQNPEVGVYQYVTAGTFSAYMWQAIERKSKFINQVMRGRLDVREIDDLGDDSLSAAEAKALASGNPLLLERSVAINETARLDRLERAHSRNQNTLRATIKESDRTIDLLTARVAAYTATLPLIRDLSGENFTITIGSTTYDKRGEAAAALTRWANAAGLQYVQVGRDRPLGPLGAVSGIPINARARSSLGEVQLELTFDGIPNASVIIPRNKLNDTTDIGGIRQIEHRIGSLNDLITRAERDIDEAEQMKSDATGSLGAPFAHVDARQAAHDNLARIDAELAAMAGAQDDPIAVPEPHAAEQPPEVRRPACAAETGPDIVPGSSFAGRGI